MKNFEVKDGRLYLNGECLPVSIRTMRATAWVHGVKHGTISESVADRILRTERRRAIEQLEKECA